MLIYYSSWLQFHFQHFARNCPKSLCYQTKKYTYFPSLQLYNKRQSDWMSIQAIKVLDRLNHVFQKMSLGGRGVDAIKGISRGGGQIRWVG